LDATIGQLQQEQNTARLDTGARGRVRVAYCLDSFSIGGTELNAVRTAEALDPARIELQVFYLRGDGPLRSRYEQLGVRMTHVPIRNLYSPQTAAQGVRLAGLLRRENIDVMHSHEIYCNIFAVPWTRWLSTCRIIASRRWGHTASSAKLAMLNRWSCRLAHRVLANSNAGSELVAGEGVPRGKIVEVPNFLEDTAFEVAESAARSAKRRSWGLPEGAFTIGIIARLAPVKNHKLLLDALARLDPRFYLVAIGDGPCRAELEAHARKLGIEGRVRFIGEVFPANTLHQCFDVSVLCSLSEGFPNSLIEAMAAGTPVIATPVGGVTDVVKDGVTGLLVPLDDPGRLADALRKLQADSELGSRLGRAALDAVRARYHRDVVINKLTLLYESLAISSPIAAAPHASR